MLIIHLGLYDCGFTEVLGWIIHYVLFIHVNTYIPKEFVHFQQEMVIICNKNNKILYTHTHTHFSYIERQIHNCGWGSPDYPERTDEHSENMLHTERLLLVGLNPGSSWCETKPNQTKNNNKKGQSLLHLVQFKHVESFLITYRQEAFKCSYSNRK